MGYRKHAELQRQVAADGGRGAREVLSDLGSKHRKKRVEITFTEIKPLAAADVTDAVVKRRSVRSDERARDAPGHGRPGAYKAQLEAINEQNQLLQMSLEDYSGPRTRWKRVAKGQPGERSDAGGRHAYVCLHSRNDRVLVGGGDRRSLDKPMEDAIATVDIRVGELMDALKKVSESRTVIESKMQQLSQMIQQEYQRMQQGLK